MTYKSNTDLLKEHKGKKLLKFPEPPARPVGGAAKNARELYYSEEVAGLLNGGDRRAKVGRALFERFVDGSKIWVRKPGKTIDQPPQYAQLVLLEARDGCPDEIWELRFRHGPERSSIHTRVFGRFAAPKIFVALTTYDKDPATNYPKLMKQCADAWDALFGTNEPHRAKYPDGYLPNTDYTRHR